MESGDLATITTTIVAATTSTTTVIYSTYSPYEYDANNHSSSSSGSDGGSSSTMGGGGGGVEDELEWLNKRFVFFILLAVYLLVIVGGVLGNGSILMTLFTSGRVPRNPLLVALCLSDFFVSGLSAPITVITSAFVQNSWRAGPTTCMTMYFLQYFPVASSTICHLMLSIDRYDTVKRPRVLHLRKKQLIPILVALLAWASAGTLSVPFLFVHPGTTANTTADQSNSSFSNSDSSTLTGYGNSPLRPPSAAVEPLNILLPRKPVPDVPSPTIDGQLLRNGSRAQLRNRICRSEEHDMVPSWYLPFILIHTICVFILPSLGILINHIRVRKKLCALSLTARAAHGELPLPMPLLRRPTHVIIVTGMANNNLTRASMRHERHRGGGGGVSGTATGGAGSGKSDQNRKPPGRDVKRKPQSKRLGRRHPPPKDEDPNDPPLDQRPMIVSSRQHNNALRATASNASTNMQQMGNPEFPLPQTSTLIFRRRLANILMTAAFLFILCWTPYIVAVFYYELKGKRSKIVTDLGLLIGYIYSALNPIIYFTLNHNSLRQSISCSLCSRIVSIRRFLRVRINNSGMAPPSSTNEAALGAFNPRYIKPKQFCKDKESSHFVY